MASAYRDGRSWTVSYRLKGQPRKYIYGIKSEKLASQIRAAKSTEEQLAKSDLIALDPRRQGAALAASVPIESHVDCWADHLQANGRTGKHVERSRGLVKRLVSMSAGRLAPIRSIADLSPNAVQARLQSIRELKLSARTINASRQAILQFCRWATAEGLLVSNPLPPASLSVANEAADRRHQRRAMSVEELSYLCGFLDGFSDTSSRRCGIDSADRAMLYRVAVATGFRQSALLSLTTASFCVDAQAVRPTIHLEAKHDKAGRGVEQPIPRWLADMLRAWLDGRPAGRVWNVRPYAVLAIRLRRDMELARKKWLAEGGDKESTFLIPSYPTARGTVLVDFHSLRHTAITMVVREAGIRVGQAFAGHSTPMLTSRYAHIELPDEQKATSAFDGMRPPARQPAPSARRLA